MKTFSYNPNKSLVENWKQWVKFRFGNKPEDMLDWEDEILFEINGNSREMSVKEAKKKTEQQILTSTESDYTKIMAEIEKAIKKGEFQIIYNNAINQTIF
jgi:hypothetical protein